MPGGGGVQPHFPAQGMQPATLVTVQATAGLRLLPGQQAESILQDVRGLLARHRFRIGDVRVMSGAEA